MRYDGRIKVALRQMVGIDLPSTVRAFVFREIAPGQWVPCKVIDMPGRLGTRLRLGTRRLKVRLEMRLRRHRRHGVTMWTLARGECEALELTHAVQGALVALDGELERGGTCTESVRWYLVAAINANPPGQVAGGQRQGVALFRGYS